MSNEQPEIAKITITIETSTRKSIVEIPMAIEPEFDIQNEPSYRDNVHTIINNKIKRMEFAFKPLADDQGVAYTVRQEEVR